MSLKIEINYYFHKISHFVQIYILTLFKNVMFIHIRIQNLKLFKLYYCPYINMEQTP